MEARSIVLFQILDPSARFGQERSCNVHSASQSVSSQPILWLMMLTRSLISDSLNVHTSSHQYGILFFKVKHKTVFPFLKFSPVWLSFRGREKMVTRVAMTKIYMASFREEYSSLLYWMVSSWKCDGRKHFRTSTTFFGSLLMLIFFLLLIEHFAFGSLLHVHEYQQHSRNNEYKSCLDLATKSHDSLKSKCVNNGLTLIENPWEASRVNNMVVKILLEEKLGICVNILNSSVTGGLELINTRGNEMPIVMLEFWKSNRVNDYK